MRFEQFYYYITVVEIGSMNSACKELHLTYQSLHSAINNFEQEIGVQLLVRNNAGVKMTENGKKVFQYAKKLLSDWESLLQEIHKEEAVKIKGTVDMKGMLIFNKKILPSLGVYFMKNYPLVQLNSTPPYIDTFRNIIDSIETESVDIGFVNLFCSENELTGFLNHGNFTKIGIGKWYVWASKQSKLLKNGKQSLSFDELRNCPLVFSDNSDPTFTNAFFEEYPYLRDNAMFLSNPHVIAQITSENMAACLDIDFWESGCYLTDAFLNKDVQAIPIREESNKHMYFGYVTSDRFEKSLIKPLIEEFFAHRMQLKVKK